MRTRMRDFLKNDRGAVTMEFVTIFPGFVLFLMLFADASVLYFTNAELFDMTRKVARGISTGAMSPGDVEDYVRNNSMLGERTIAVGLYTGNVVVVEMSVNIGDASIFGFFVPVLGKHFVKRVVMLREPGSPGSA